MDAAIHGRRDGMSARALTRSRRLAAALAVLVIAVLLVTARRTAVDTFYHHAVETAPADTGALPPALSPQSIIAFHVDPETDRSGVIDVTPPPPPPPPPARPDTTTVRPQAPDRSADLDLDDLIDRAADPRGNPAPAGVAAVPPRPVEITWPETRKLRQCIGTSVTVRIWVSEEGKVKDAQVVSDFNNRGFVPRDGGPPDELAAFVKSEIGRWGQVVKQAGAARTQ